MIAIQPRAEQAININEDINPNFSEMFQSTQEDLLIYGGAGAGKSYGVAQRHILKALYHGNRHMLIVRKTFPALKITALKMLKEIMDLYHIPYTENKGTPYTIKLPRNSEMIFLPVVNTTREAAERIKSMTDVTDIWIEESTELTKEEYIQLSLRLRGKEENIYRQITQTFNPIDQNHWIKKHFFDHDIGKRLKYTHKDNRFLNASYRARLEALKEENPILYKVFALGEWGTPQDIIYTKWITKSFDYPLTWFNEVVTGEDFGYTNPSVHLIIGFKDEPGEKYEVIYIIDEIYQTQLLNPAFISLIIDKDKEWGLNVSDVPHYPDNAEPDRIEEMRAADLFVYDVKKAVVPGIHEVQKHKIVIHPRCVNTIKEIQGYRNKVDKFGNRLEEPVKFNDHAMDVIRDIIYTKYKQENREVSQF